MSHQADESVAESKTLQSNNYPEVETLLSQIEQLRNENQSLREQAHDDVRGQYRRGAIAFIALASLAFIGSVLFNTVQELLIILGTTGLFAAVFLIVSTTIQPRELETGRRIFQTMAQNTQRLQSQLGLTDMALYIPVGTTDEEISNTWEVRLYVPNKPTFDVPSTDHLLNCVLVSDPPGERGISLDPTGLALLWHVRSNHGSVPKNTVRLETQLTEWAVKWFGLTEEMDIDISIGEDDDTFTATIQAEGIAYKPIDEFDNPLVSLVASCLALWWRGPCTVEVIESGNTARFAVRNFDGQQR